MKRRRIAGRVGYAVLAFFILPLPSWAVYDPGGAVRKGQRWAISTGLRTGYDDNTTTATTDKHASWFNGMDINGRYSYPTDTTFVSVSTGARGTFFIDRPGSDFDFNDSFDFTLAHTFSPRLNLDITDALRFGQEPQLEENNSVLRRTGNYVNNGVNVGLSYQLTTKWFMDLGFNHDLWSYEDSTLGNVLDRQAIGGGPSLRYRLTEKTSLSLNYRFTRTAYDTSPRSANTHAVTAGISQSFTRRWSISLDAGGELRQEDNEYSHRTLTSPYANFTTSYMISETARLFGGVRYSFQETDISTFFESYTVMGYGGFHWDFARHFSSDTNLNLVNNQLSDPLTAGTANVSEWTYLVTESINWNLRENINLSLDYTFTRLDSEVALRGYRRNVVTLKASYLF